MSSRITINVIIMDAHEGHGTGVEHMLTELRTKYWVIKGRRAFKNVVEKCQQCRLRFGTKQLGQLMASLPRARVELPLRAFNKIAIDYGGPFYTKQGRGKSR